MLPVLLLLPGFQESGLFFIHLVLRFLFLGLDGIQHLLSLLRRKARATLILLRPGLLFFILLILILVVLIVLIVPVLVFLILTATTATALILQHQSSIDVILLRIQIPGIPEQRLLVGLDSRLPLLLPGRADPEIVEIIRTFRQNYSHLLERFQLFPCFIKIVLPVKR